MKHAWILAMLVLLAGVAWAEDKGEIIKPGMTELQVLLMYDSPCEVEERYDIDRTKIWTYGGKRGKKDGKWFKDCDVDAFGGKVVIIFERGKVASVMRFKNSRELIRYGWSSDPTSLPECHLLTERWCAQ